MEQEVIEFAYLLKAARHEVTHRLNQAFKPLGITCVQADVLIALGEQGPMSLKELSNRVVAESGNPSRLIDRMTGSGLVQRTASEHDGRQSSINLTRTGRALLKRVYQARQPLIDEFVANLDPDAIRSTATLLRQLVSGPR